MKPHAFHATVRCTSDVATIDLNGEVNAFAESAINQAYEEAMNCDPRLIVLNFTHVSYINSTGIALIVGLLAQARKTHNQLAVYGLSNHYLRIFQITRLSDFMTIYPDEQTVFENAAGW